MANTAANQDDFEFVIDSIVSSNPIDDIAIDFTDITKTPLETTPPPADITDPKEKEKAKSDSVSKIEEEIEIDFGIGGKVKSDSLDNSGKDSKKSGDSDTPSTVFKIIAEGLAEKNILSEEDLKEFDGSEEKFLELFDNRIEQRTSEEVTSFANSLGEDGKAFIRHVQSGGTFETFKNFKESGVSDDMLSTEDGQKQIIKNYLTKTTKYSEEKINKEIERIVKYGELEQVAKENYDDLSEIIKSEQSEQEKLSALNKEEMKKRQAEAINSVRTLINESKEIKGIPISFDKKDKLELTDYILKPTVKLPNGQMVTQYVKDQMDETEELNKGNYESYLFKALLMKNKYDSKIFTNSVENKTKLNMMKNLENLDLNNWTSTKSASNLTANSEKDKSKINESWKKSFADEKPAYIKL